MGFVIKYWFQKKEDEIAVYSDNDVNNTTKDNSHKYSQFSLLSRYQLSCFISALESFKMASFTVFSEEKSQRRHPGIYKSFINLIKLPTPLLLLLIH